MLANIIEALTYVFAIYGVATVLESVLNYISTKNHYMMQKYHLILTVKNQQDNIEGVIRNIFNDELFKNSGPECKVIVIDKGSEDDTVKILKRLAREYLNLEIRLEEGPKSSTSEEE